MDKVKEFISNNKFLIIAGILLLIVCAGLYFFDYKNKSKEYTKEGETENIYVKREYKANEYANIDVELIDILNDYYSYFIKVKYTDTKTAYNLLAEETKEKYDTYESYKAYVDHSKTIQTFKNKIKEYRKNPDNKYAYDIIDTEGNKYTFIENAVWDIKVIDKGK